MLIHRLSVTVVATALTLAPLTGCDEKQPGTSADPIDDEDDEGKIADDDEDEQPGQPEQPADPEQPEQPEQPSEPGEPEQPEQPEEPSEPHPEDPGKEPEQPEEPEEPNFPPQSEWPEEAVPCPEVAPAECEVDGKPGTSQCVIFEDVEVWTACVADDDWFNTCTPGDNYDMGCVGGYCAYDGEKLFWYEWQTEPDCETPLVLSFDDAPIRFEAAVGAPSFDFAGTGASAGGNTCTTDWPSAPWLALDRDRDGSIDSGRELFGSGTRLASGRRATHGFEALAELDADGDGRITPADPRFAELVLWNDHDADRSGELSELQPASTGGLVAIHLDFQRRGECDERGNCGFERAAFEYRDASGQPRIGEIVDVYLACQ